MEEFKKDNIPDMEDEDLNILVLKLGECYNKQQINFAETCYYVWRIVKYYDGQNRMFLKDKKGEYFDKKLLLLKFGFDIKAVSRLKNCYERFCFSTIDGRDIKLLEQFQSYSPSKLYELLPLTDEAIEKCLEKQIIKSSMTVKEIRKTIKSLINGEQVEKLSNPNLDNEEIDEEEIPMAYDPSNEYDFEYYKSKSKNQLLNMIWTLQNAYHKLRNKRK